jgi:NAD-dependent dihydropyrimidine dehydrogenase PreA subunit
MHKFLEANTYTFYQEVLKVFIVSIDEELCTGCQECSAGCPAHLLKFNGEKTEVKGDPSDCLGCESCVIVCAAGAISITEM